MEPIRVSTLEVGLVCAGFIRLRSLVGLISLVSRHSSSLSLPGPV
jgi:hypothetical protein